jgi:hypothetical protein
MLGLDASPVRAAVDPNSAEFTGVLSSVSNPTTAAVRAHDGGTEFVSTADVCSIVHGWEGGVEDLTPFVVGEEVIVRGTRAQSRVIASEFASVYREMHGSLLEDLVGDRTIRTSAGEFHLPSVVLERSDVPDLRAGSRFVASVWINPETAEPFAAIIRSD